MSRYPGRRSRAEDLAVEDPVDEHDKEKDAEELKVHHRRSWAWEQLRMLIQIAVAAPVLFATWAVFASLYVGVLPQHVPRRVFEDTFGKLEDLLNWEPPSMDRSRFEAEGNIWRPFVFSSASALGALQDLAFGVFNWGARSILRGPALSRAAALLGSGSAGLVGLMLLPLVAAGPLALPMQLLLRHLPEHFLTLDQLLIAHLFHGRTLRPELLKAATEAAKNG